MKKTSLNLATSALILVVGSAMLFAQAVETPETKIAPSGPSREPVALDRGPQLFIDDFLIAESTGLARTTHSPTRFLDKPIIGPDAGVGETYQPFLTVLRDPETKTFRMWYGWPEGCIAYGESDDGIQWKLPKLGINESNNMVLKINIGYSAYFSGVVDDGPGAPNPARRYKAIWWGHSLDPARVKDQPAGIMIAFSPDGLHWQPFEGNPVLPSYCRIPNHPLQAFGSDDVIHAFRDPIRNRYALLNKAPPTPDEARTIYRPAPKGWRRLVVETISDDFVKWARPWRVIVPEKRDEGLTEFYAAGGAICRGPLLIAFARVLRDDLPAEPGGPVEGIGYSTIVTSRDGESWQRFNDVFLDRNPKPGTWDRAFSWIGSVVEVGDEFYLYYGGYRLGHKLGKQRENRQLGLVKMKKDRFVSRGATGDAAGRLRTVPLVLPKDFKGFTANADATGGRIHVAVLTTDGTPIAGFGAAEAMALDGDGLAQPLQWAGADPASLAGQTVRLEFEIRNARLFGFDVIR